MLAGHGAELSTSREDDIRRRRRGSTTRPGGKRSATEGGLGCGGGDGMRRRDELDGRAGLGDGGEIEDGGGGGEDRRVDRKVEDEQNRNRLIYIGRDPLVPAGNTNRD